MRNFDFENGSTASTENMLKTWLLAGGEYFTSSFI
jgi:hypothetical protein